MSGAAVRPRAVVIDVDGLDRLIAALVADGRTVVGPTVRDGAIVCAPLTSSADLPRGLGDEQDAGHYRLRERDDDAFFGFSTTAASWKRWLFPARQLLWRATRGGDGPTLEPDEGPPPRLALLGVRGCDLAALGSLDSVLAGDGDRRPARDPHYVARREATLVVAVACASPGGTCFCASRGTGPVPGNGADVVLAELAAGTPQHRFLATAGSSAGRALLTAAGLDGHEADEADLAVAQAQAKRATAAMGRTLASEGLAAALVAGADDPHWDDVGSRCLACTGCTLVCPTCFCTSVDDATPLGGEVWERWRTWDSCFTASFSYVHGGPVRESTGSRYRQWATHKLSTWERQFGTTGCVGCGRCITWCPVGIDITVEASAVQARARREEPVP